MKPLSIFLALSSTLFLAACANPPLSGAGAAPQPKVDEHAAHQAAAAATPASPAASSHMQHPMQDHMKSMQSMREKMMAARTPAERQQMAFHARQCFERRFTAEAMAISLTNTVAEAVNT